MMRRPDVPPKSLSAGVVVVRRDAQRFRLLCVRAFDRWDFPKVDVPDADDALAAALAEVRETTALDPLELPWGEDYRETVPSADGRVSRYYLARAGDVEVTLRVPPGPHAGEDYEFRWVTYEEAEDILPPSLSLVLDWVVGRLAADATRPRGTPS